MFFVFEKKRNNQRTARETSSFVSLCEQRQSQQSSLKCRIHGSFAKIFTDLSMDEEWRAEISSHRWRDAPDRVTVFSTKVSQIRRSLEGR